MLLGPVSVEGAVVVGKGGGVGGVGVGLVTLVSLAASQWSCEWC